MRIQSKDHPMHLTCMKCARANPPDALYCHHDGIALRSAPATGPVSIGQKPFSVPFVLPDGTHCRNFDQLAVGCQANWSGAVATLGHLENRAAAICLARLAAARGWA